MNKVKNNLAAAKTALFEPNRVTVKCPVLKMRDDPDIFKPRDFDAEYAEQGFSIDHAALNSALHDVRMAGFALAAGLDIIKAYQAGRQGKPIKSAVSWIGQLEECSAPKGCVEE